MESIPFPKCKHLELVIIGKCFPIKTGRILCFITRSTSRKECELKFVFLKIYYFLVTDTPSTPKENFLLDDGQGD